MPAAPRSYLIVVPRPLPRFAWQVLGRGAQSDARGAAQVPGRGAQAVALDAETLLQQEKSNSADAQRSIVVM
jgi:hypothetical protein